MMLNFNCRYISDYIDMIDCDYQPFCKEQKQIAELTKRIFENEDIAVDCEQAAKYFSYQKYFPFKLFEWEKFAFTIHNCVYTANRDLRFPTLDLLVGRGAGKNGYLSFENFCLLTPTNGVKDYHIDTFAISEDQAKTSFEELYNILQGNPKHFKNFFYWNKEYIKNLQTGSKYRFRTSNFKTKDSGRQGKVDFDEIHMLENYKLIEVGTSGLGKKKYPRRTFLSTDGCVREGPLDDIKANAEQILTKNIEDNGEFPLIYKLDDISEVHDEKNWVKANPSLPYMPTLLKEIRRQYGEYVKNPNTNSDFITKRMNLPLDNQETCVTSYENIKKTNQPLLPIKDKSAILCFDFAASRDFATVGAITRHDRKIQFNQKTFVLKSNKDLPRIKAPLKQWERQGLLQFVDGIDINPDYLIDWSIDFQTTNDLFYEACALDYFRYPILKKQLDALGFESGKNGNLKLIRPSNIMINLPIIISTLENGNVICGDNPLFRWCCGNTKKSIADKRGNEIFEKIEPKSRKTDTFMCFVNGMCAIEMLPEDISFGEFLSPMIF